MKNILIGIDPAYQEKLCELWEWNRPDGQLKDMACRELLRKLESRFLITLPPRQCPGPGKGPVTIKPVKINTSPICCKFSELQPVKIIDARKSA